MRLKRTPPQRARRPSCEIFSTCRSSFSSDDDGINCARILQYLRLSVCFWGTIVRFRTGISHAGPHLRGGDMKPGKTWHFGIAALAVLLAACQSQPGGAKAELSGVVTSANGPEAGVWVIAETTDLPTKYTKIVVTDDRGRYLVPDLPQASYSVWVRGYGLVDSPKVQATPGRTLDLTAVV